MDKDKDKLVGLFIAALAAVATAGSFPLLRSVMPHTIPDNLLMPAFTPVIIFVWTLAWYATRYLFLIMGPSRELVGIYLSYNRQEGEIGLFSISVKKLGSVYKLDGIQYSVAERRKVGRWSSSAPLSVQIENGAPRVSYMYTGINRSRAGDATRGYSSIQFVGDNFAQGNGLYIDDTQIQSPTDQECAMAQINLSSYWKLEKGILRRLGANSAKEILRDPKIVLNRMTSMSSEEVEHWLNGVD